MRELGRYAVPGPPIAFDFTRDRVYVPDRRSVRVLAGSTGKRVAQLRLPAAPRLAAWSGDRATLYLAVNRHIIAWRVDDDTQRTIDTPDDAQPITYLAEHRDGSRLIVAKQYFCLQAYDVATGRQIWGIRHDARFHHVRPDVDGLHPLASHAIGWGNGQRAKRVLIVALADGETCAEIGSVDPFLATGVVTHGGEAFAFVGRDRIDTSRSPWTADHVLEHRRIPTGEPIARHTIARASPCNHDLAALDGERVLVTTARRPGDRESVQGIAIHDLASGARERWIPEARGPVVVLDRRYVLGTWDRRVLVTADDGTPLATLADDVLALRLWGRGGRAYAMRDIGGERAARYQLVVFAIE